MHPSLLKIQQIINPSVLTRIHDPLLDQYSLELWMKRDDLLHPVISGNKWRKLKYILDHALSLGTDTLISMGGQHSNHLHALAYVGKLLGLKTIGLIRGEIPAALTPTLRDISAWGMELRSVSRSEYRMLRQYKNWHDLPGLMPGQYWVTEGGAQPLALRGVAELVQEIDIVYHKVCVPVGTGATLAGIIAATPETALVMGFAVLKGAGFLVNDVSTLLTQSCHHWQINLDYHFGGFGKSNADLHAFIESFERHNSIALDPVYTGKMMYAVYDLIKKRFFIPGERIVVVHTGGLQGKRSLHLL